MLPAVVVVVQKRVDRGLEVFDTNLDPFEAVSSIAPRKFEQVELHFDQSQVVTALSPGRVLPARFVVDAWSCRYHACTQTGGSLTPRVHQSSP